MHFLMYMYVSLQLGTLGAGNHYAEIQVVEEIYDGLAATRMGIEEKGQVSGPYKPIKINACVHMYKCRYA